MGCVYVLRRALSYAGMVWLATSIGYIAAVVALRPRERLLLATPRPTETQVDTRLAAYGLDPHAALATRYLDWLGGVLRGDWGRSPDGAQVSAQFVSRALVSGRLLLLATVLMVVLGVALGVYAASRAHRLQDRTVTAATYVLSCLPAPVVYLCVQLGAIQVNRAAGHRLLPVTGMGSPVPPDGVGARLADGAAHLLVPTLALTLVGYTGYQLLQRALLLDDVDADYVRAARARGLTRGRALRRHALRTTFIPVAQSAAFALPAVFAGTFVVETAFAWDGLGRYTLEAITHTRDVNAAVAGIAFGGAVFAVGAILADAAVALVDPRVRRSWP